MANDLISRNALLAEYDRVHIGEPGNARKLIADAPTVDAVEVVHGRWEPRTDAIGFVRCSVCHDCNIYDDWADGKKWNYCPNCGAKMDGDIK